MASKTQQFIYALRAKYEGKGEVAALSSDLKAMGDIKSFQKLETDFAGTTAALTDAKAKMRELKTEMNNSFDSKIQDRIGKTNEKIDKLSGTYTKQQNRLGILSDKLRMATEAHKKFGSSLSGEQTEEQAGQLQDLALAVEKSDVAYRQHQLTLGNTADKLTETKKEVKGLREAFSNSVDPALRKQYSATRDEVQKLSTKVREQKTVLDGSHQAMVDQGFAMGDLAGEYERLDASTTSHGQKIAAMKTLGVRSFASIEQEVQSLHSAYEILEKDPSISAAELSAARVSMEADITALTGNTGELVDKWDLMKRGLAAVAGLAVSGFGLATMAVQAGDAAKDLENLARVAGTSVEELSALAYATESVGISQEKLADMSKDVKDKIGDFIENGGGEFKDFFENVAPLVGITAEELIKMSGPDCLVAIKKAMDDANVSAESQVFYLEAIANDASLLTPLLQDNGKALKEKADRARELGIAISDMDNAKLVEMGVVAKELGGTMSVLTREIVSAIAPAIQVLMGHAQKAVAWFNQLSPGVQKFIVFAVLGATAVTAMGVAFAPLISSIALGVPLIASIATGVGAMTSSMSLGVIVSRALSIAMRGIPFIAVALLVYQVGSALGWWKPIMNAVQKGVISLAAGIHLLGLKIRWLWNVLTGDDAEAAAIEKRMAEVDKMYGEMFANIGKKQDEHVENTKENQAKLTEEVRKGAGERLAIEQEVQKKIAALSTGEDGESAEKGAKGKKKGKKKEEPDEFGFLPSERKLMDAEVEKLDDSRRKGRAKGGGISKGEDGVWRNDYTDTSKSDDKVNDILRQAEKDESTPVSKEQTSKNKKSEPEKQDEFGFTPLERKSMDSEYNALVENSRNRIADLPKLEPNNSRSSSSGDQAASRVVEIKFPSASTYSDEDSTEKVISDLQRMGAMA